MNENMMQSIQQSIEKACEEAARGCGQSDILYSKRLQPLLKAIMDQAPDSIKDQVYREIVKEGYLDGEEFEPEEGCCALTGIEENCCPCGRHA